MYRALEIPGHKNLSDLSYFLFSRGVPHKITEESGKLIIWTGTAENAVTVVESYKQWQAGELKIDKAPPRRGINFSGIVSNIPWKQLPLTLFFIVICSLVAVITQLGADWKMVSKFTFVPFSFTQYGLTWQSFSEAMAQGQYWRVISPVFLHFGILHFAFNMLSLFIFGSRLEVRQGAFHLFGIIIFTGLLSNIAQYLWGGSEAVFGGFSGVVYGLMGYCMVREKVDKQWHFGLPPVFYGFMLIWLVIGYTDILSSSLGNMANAAHTGGLLSGALLGALAGILFRHRPQVTEE